MFRILVRVQGLRMFRIWVLGWCSALCGGQLIALGGHFTTWLGQPQQKPPAFRVHAPGGWGGAVGFEHLGFEGLGTKTVETLGCWKLGLLIV